VKLGTCIYSTTLAKVIQPRLGCQTTG